MRCFGVVRFPILKDLIDLWSHGVEHRATPRLALLASWLRLRQGLAHRITADRKLPGDRASALPFDQYFVSDNMNLVDPQHLRSPVVRSLQPKATGGSLGLGVGQF